MNPKLKDEISEEKLQEIYDFEIETLDREELNLTTFYQHLGPKQYLFILGNRARDLVFQ